MIVFEVGTARLVVLNREYKNQETTNEVERALKYASRNIAVGEVDIHSQTRKSETLAKIIFYIHERAKCTPMGAVDQYLDHVLDYCKKDYQEAENNYRKVSLSMEEIEKEYELMSEKDAEKRKVAWFKRED